MKKLRKLFMMMVAISTMMAAMIFTVSADEATDLSEMMVYALDASGNKTEVPMSFSATTYEYDLTVKSDVVSIEIEAKVKDSTSKWEVEKDGINTKMDTGINKTVVAVTSSAGAVQKYTLNTKKLTTAEEATYQAPKADESGKTKKSDKDTSVKVGKKTMKISTSFGKDKIPEGFKKATEKYKGKKYACIKGEVKDITAFYLYGKNKEGFYIYDSEKDEFYLMNNIQIKSRMYTIVQPQETDGIVEAYKKKKVTIIDQKVEAWVLDEEEGMYLVYAMNWNGETSLYSYDDNEKCFQRYLTSSDANRQSEAAAKAYNTLQKDYNKLVDKYNVLIKILCGLVILIIILIFVVINLALNKKEKKVRKNNKYSEEIPEQEDNKELSKADKKAAKKEAKQAKKEEKKKQNYEQDDDDIDSGIAIDEEKKYQEEAEEHLAAEVQAFGDMEEMIDIEAEDEIVEDEAALVVDLEEKEAETSKAVETAVENEEKLEETPKKKLFERKPKIVPYGDEPTFGTDKQSEEGFYGGEAPEEDEVFIDIVDDGSEIKEVDEEEDLKATMKSLLPDEQDDDDDDDFEFIDLN